MPKTSRSQKMDFKGLEIIADEFTGKTNLTGNSAINALTAETTPNGTDATSTQTLANALKVKVNAIIAALKA